LPDAPSTSLFFSKSHRPTWQQNIACRRPNLGPCRNERRWQGSPRACSRGTAKPCIAVLCHFRQSPFLLNLSALYRGDCSFCGHFTAKRRAFVIVQVKPDSIRTPFRGTGEIPIPYRPLLTAIVTTLEPLLDGQRKSSHHTDDLQIAMRPAYEKTETWRAMNWLYHYLMPRCLKDLEMDGRPVQLLPWDVQPVFRRIKQ
jgi:hypothetical protein